MLYLRKIIRSFFLVAAYNLDCLAKTFIFQVVTRNLKKILISIPRDTGAQCNKIVNKFLTPILDPTVQCVQQDFVLGSSLCALNWNKIFVMTRKAFGTTSGKSSAAGRQRTRCETRSLYLKIAANKQSGNNHGKFYLFLQWTLMCG